MKKRIFTFIVMMFMICLLSACRNPFVEAVRPFGQPGTKWATNDGRVTFAVQENTYGYCDYGATGQIDLQNQTINFYMEDGRISYEIWLYPAEHSSCIRQQTQCVETHSDFELWIPDYCWFCKDEFSVTVQSSTYFTEGEVLQFHRVEE